MSGDVVDDKPSSLMQPDWSAIPEVDDAEPVDAGDEEPS